MDKELKLKLLKVLFLAQQPKRVDARAEIIDPHGAVATYRGALEDIEALIEGEVK